MRTNKCPECDAHNRLKSTRCGNCGADITIGGKLKYNIKMAVIVIGVIAIILALKN